MRKRGRAAEGRSGKGGRRVSEALSHQSLANAPSALAAPSLCCPNPRLRTGGLPRGSGPFPNSYAPLVGRWMLRASTTCGWLPMSDPRRSGLRPGVRLDMR